jgi:hypothetical protein
LSGSAPRASGPIDELAGAGGAAVEVQCSDPPAAAPTWAMITVIVGWIVGWSTFGTWRMVTRDA